MAIGRGLKKAGTRKRACPPALPLDAGRQLPGEQYHELRYEDLVACPQKEADRLLEYLGITSRRSCLLFGEASARARPDSVGGWRGELSKPQLEQVLAEAGPFLTRLGYLTTLSVSV